MRAFVALAVAYALALQAILLAVGPLGVGKAEFGGLPICSGSGWLRPFGRAPSTVGTCRRLPWDLPRLRLRLPGVPPSRAGNGICSGCGADNHRRLCRRAAVPCRRVRCAPHPWSAACLTVPSSAARSLSLWQVSTRSRSMTNSSLRSISGSIAAMVALCGAPFLLAQFSISPAAAADYDVGSMHISQPWARATPKGATTAPAT